MAELCDIYNISGNKTGKVFTRGESLKEGEYQLVTNIWIINNDFNILIQKRSETKKISPNIWATHGGCVGTQETSFNGCIREAYEEIGISLKTKNIKPLTRIKSERLIMDSYIIVQEFDTSSAVLQAEEVSEIQWVSLNKLEHMVNDKSFFKYQELPCVINFISNHKSIREI